MKNEEYTRILDYIKRVLFMFLLSFYTYTINTYIYIYTTSHTSLLVIYTEDNITIGDDRQLYAHTRSVTSTLVTLVTLVTLRDLSHGAGRVG